MFQKPAIEYLLLLIFTVLSVSVLLLFSGDICYVLIPLLLTLIISLFFWITLTNRRKELPIDDPGLLTVLAIVLYTVFPSIQFLLSGMEPTLLSASQLYTLAPTPEQYGRLTWWYVFYLLSFTAGYLFADKEKKEILQPPLFPDRFTVYKLAIIYVLLSVIMFAIEIVYDIKLYGEYDMVALTESYDALLQMPLIFRQFYGMIGHTGIFFIVKLSILLLLFLYWEKRSYRYALFIWLSFIFISNIIWMGARTELVLIFISSVIMYHRFVRELKLKQILPAGIVLFVVFMVIGVLRGGANLESNLQKIDFDDTSFELVASKNTEFQALFAGNYDLLQMKQNGFLTDVPLQFILYDVIMLIPQQVLPFEKMDVQEWITSRSNNPGYFMYNPISQAIVGFGWVELLVRGVVLGVLLALVRRWYRKRCGSYWATLFYLYIVVISYYTIRGTALYFLFASTLFRFIPLYFIVKLLPNFSVKLPKLLKSTAKP